MGHPIQNLLADTLLPINLSVIDTKQLKRFNTLDNELNWSNVLVAKYFPSAKRLRILVTDFVFGARVNISHMQASFLLTITHIASGDYTQKIPTS